MTEKVLHTGLSSGNMDRRTFLKVAGLLGATVALGLPLLGCQPPPAPKKTFQINAAEPTRMAQYSPFYLALLRGFYDAEGVPTVWTEMAGGGEQVRAITTGTFQLGIVAPGAAIAAYEAGEPIRIVATAAQGGGGAVIARADSPFKKPEDLKGRKFKIGYSRPNSNTHLLNMLSLRVLGIDPNDAERVTQVATGGAPDTWAAVKTGIVDLGWSIDPLITQIETSGEGRALWYYWDLVPDWVDGVVMTTQRFIDEQPQALEAWLKAYAKGIEWFLANRSEAARLVAGYLNTSEEAVAAGFKKFPDSLFSAALRQKALDFTYKTLVEFKLAKGNVKWDELVVRKFLPANLRSA